MSQRPQIGFMQGRLCPQIDGKIQAFPWRDWRLEFPAAQGLGFDLMEWTIDHDRIGENPLMTVVGRAEIAALAARHGVKVCSVTGDNFMQAPFWKVEGKRRSELIEVFRRLIVACGKAGVRFIVVPFVDAGAIASPEQEDLIVETFIGLTSTLEEAKVRIVFESDYPPLELKRFVARLPVGRFGVNYDIGNSASFGYDTASEIAAYGDRILNVHVKDRLLGGATVPLGTGAADLPRAINALGASGYRGAFILQTARAADGDHEGALARYRDLVLKLLDEAGRWT